MTHIVQDFSIVNEAEVDVFLELSYFLHDPVNVGSMISDSSAFSKFSLYIWKFLVHVLLKPSLRDFEHNVGSMWNECNCAVVWTFFGIAFLWDRNENWSFQFCGHCWIFQICQHVECSSFTGSSFRIWNSSTGIPKALYLYKLWYSFFSPKSTLKTARCNAGHLSNWN